MITNKMLPAHILRLYTWEVLKDHGGMELIDGLVPIIPVEDEPKVSDKNKAYIIYGYAESESRRQGMRQGTISFRIIAPTFSQLGRISNVIAMAFESEDISTEAVNRYSSAFPNNTLVGIQFTRTKTSYIEGGEASETEGGPMDGIVNVSFEYINHLPIPVPEVARGGLWS